MPALTTYTADIQDRDGGPGVIEQACDSFPAPVCIFADGSYSGDGVKDAFKAFDGPAIEIVKRLQGVTGFIVSARRRRVLERTFARPGRCRRPAKDVEATIKSAVAWITIASIRLMISRLART